MGGCPFPANVDATLKETATVMLSLLPRGWLDLPPPPCLGSFTVGLMKAMFRMVLRCGRGLQGPTG